MLRTAASSSSPAQLAQWAGEASALLKALAHPDRLMLVCQLVEAELSVSELGERTAVAQPSLSQHLAVLRAQGLVLTRREGKNIHYRVGSPAALAVLKALHEVYCAPRRSGRQRRSPS